VVCGAAAERTADGRVAVAPKSAWADGTTHHLFEPVELRRLVPSSGAEAQGEKTLT
jgi:hypothetical protein